MKAKIIILSMTLGALSLFTYELNGQEKSKVAHNRMDSIQKANKNLNEKTMDNAKDLSKETKAKAKEAKRVEQDANNASNESRKALKTEKKAQKTRKNADNQSKKAQEAREKSDSN